MAEKKNTHWVNEREIVQIMPSDGWFSRWCDKETEGGEFLTRIACFALTRQTLIEYRLPGGRETGEKTDEGMGVDPMSFGGDAYADFDATSDNFLGIVHWQEMTDLQRKNILPPSGDPKT